MTQALKLMEFQKEFVKRLFVSSDVEPFKAPTVLELVSNCEPEILQLILGDTGCHLRQITETLDLDHPDVVSLFGGFFKDEEKFSQQCVEMIKLAELAKNYNLNHLISILGEKVAEDAKKTIKLVVDPSKNQMAVRFLKDPNEREELRMQKRMQLIDLQNFYKKGINFWESLPDGFYKFLRYDEAYKEDLELAEKKADRYEKLGCTFLADEIKKTIESFRSNMQQAYFGFNRITMTNAAVILAKSLGYRFSSILTSWETLERKNYILVDREIYAKSTIDFDFSSLVCQSSDSGFLYEPRVYPFHLFVDIASEETRKIVKHLEELPEANRKPIFDHLGVIIPGIKYFEKNTFKIPINLKTTKYVSSFDKKEDFMFSLDKTLLQKKVFDAIIIAEKDGKCYFVCYFN